MEKVKKIIFTVTNDLSYDQRMARICGTLSTANYEVEIVGRKRKNSSLLKHKNYKQTRLNCIFQKGKLFYVEYSFRLFFYLLFHRVDIISSVDLDSLMACTFVAKIRSKKLVFDAHEYFTEVPEVTNRKFTKKIWQTVGKLCIPQTNIAYTVGESLAEIFTTKYHKVFEVIRNVPLINENYVNPQLSYYDNKTIIYQGDLNEGRGLEQTIEAMQYIDAELWIAGNGLLMDKLKELAQQFNVVNRVKFLGYIYPDELKKITQQATIGINLLENKGLSYYYSLANKFFDYLHAEIPQVCAPFPEYQKINNQYHIALLCECDVIQIKNTLNRLLTDEILYKKLQTECNKAKQIFNWQHEEQKLLSIYSNV